MCIKKNIHKNICESIQNIFCIQSLRILMYLIKVFRKSLNYNGINSSIFPAEDREPECDRVRPGHEEGQVGLRAQVLCPGQRPARH